MKNIIQLLSAFCLTFFCLPSLASGIPTLTTNGYSEIVVQPDMAEFSTAIEVISKDATQAKIEVDKVTANFVDALINSGIASGNISSSNLQLAPQYQYPNPKASGSQAATLTGYRAIRDITVTVQELSKLNTYLDVALSTGINRINNIKLKVKDREKIQAQARQAAIDNAKEKALILAKGFDAKLDGIWSINYQSSNVQPVMYRSMAQSKSIDQSYQDQSLTITDQVNVVYKLK